MDCKISSEDSAQTSSNNILSSYKVCSMESRLQLKRGHVESTNSQKNVLEEASNKEEAVQKAERIDTQYDTSPTNENDSILDFKSPESKKVKQTKLARFQRVAGKKKKLSSSKFNVVVNSHRETKIKESAHQKEKLQKSQPSIESSFFKSKNEAENKDVPTDIKTAFVCPLCFKPCKDLDSQALHMKGCAIKNNISTKKLFDAIELQKRQASERESLGLLIAPIVQDKKKSLPRKTNVYEDSDLELALALSKSLQEAEELNEINETETLIRISDPLMHQTSEPAYKGQLETFGFANSKTVTFNKSKKKRHLQLTVLQTRSDEERGRILTEKIAQILVGNEAITQDSHENTEYDQPIKQKVILRSSFLQDIHCTEDKLWNQTTLAPNQTYFYVAELATHITPCKEKLQDICQYFQIDDDLFDHTNVLETNNMEQKHCEKSVYPVENKEAPNSDCLEYEDIKDASDEDDKFTNTVITNWGNALNDSSASDLIIFVNNDKHIWVHKLVFYVRCSNLLLDIAANDNTTFIRIKEKICWPDISYYIALAFLEFIYCGIINKYANVFEDCDAFSHLRNLARRYKVTELFAYLRKKEARIKQSKVQTEKFVSITENENSKSIEILTDTDHVDNKNESIVQETKQPMEKDLCEQEHTENISPLSQAELNISFLHKTQSKLEVSSDIYHYDGENKCAMEECEKLTKKNVDEQEHTENILTVSEDEVEINLSYKTQAKSINVSSNTHHFDSENKSKMKETDKSTINDFHPQAHVESVLTHSEVEFQDIPSHAIQHKSLLMKDPDDKLKGDICMKDSPKTKINSMDDTAVFRARSITPDMFDDTDDLMSDINKSEKEINVITCDTTTRETETSNCISTALTEQIDITSSPESRDNAPFENVKCMQEKFEEMEEKYFIDALNARKSPGHKNLSRNVHESTTCSNVARQKSNLSLFIEKVQTENAKPDFDTDSEIDSVLQISTKLKRNPFNVKQFDESETSFKLCSNPVTQQRLRNKPNVLDMFDRSITDRGINRSQICENIENMNNRSHERIQNETDLIEELDHNINEYSTPRGEEKMSTSVSSESDIDEREISVYTRYRQEHRNNSIAKYRANAKEYISSNSTLHKEKEKNESIIENNAVDSLRNKTDDVLILSDLDVDLLDSTDSLLKKVHGNQEVDEKASSGDKESPNMKSRNVDTFGSLDSLHIEQLKELDNIYDTEKDILANSRDNNDIEIINDERVHCFTRKNSLETDDQTYFSEVQATRKINALRHSKSDSNIGGQKTRVSSMSPTCLQNDVPRPLESPVLVASSPELSMDDLNTTAMKAKKTFSWDKINRDSDNDEFFEKEIYLANVRIDDKEDNDDSSFNEKANQLEKCHILNNDENNSIVSRDSSKQDFERKRKLDTAGTSLRKFGRKSMSEGNFNLQQFKKDTSEISNLTNEPRCKCGRKKMFKGTSRPIIIVKDVTPPPDYNRMQSPELHQELKKYGLKLQKRSRAVKLLSYIYNELHPVVSMTKDVELGSADLSKEDETPTKKKKLNQDCFSESNEDVNDNDCDLPLSQFSNRNAHSPIHVIAEEMQFDETESTSAVDNVRNIKDVFLKLIKANKELHNKILSYEPLCIESLHAMIKAEGFKCKINTLMDFLDEQCITFYLQENSVRNRARRN